MLLQAAAVLYSPQSQSIVTIPKFSKFLFIFIFYNWLMQ